jgi:ribosomal protein S15P/S13E
MMKNCFNEGVLQAFLDNELAPETSQTVAAHIGDCNVCAALLTDIEEETAVAFSALEREFNTLVPTHRLWLKINESIETERKSQGIWQRIVRFSAPFAGLKLNFANLSAMASLLFVFTVFGAMFALKSDDQNIADNFKQPIKEINPPIQVAGTPSSETQDTNNIQQETENFTNNNLPKNDVPQFRVEKAGFINREINLKAERVRSKPKNDVSAVPQYIDGEENYVKTITRLERAVNDNKNAVLSPSAQVSYEKDLAIVNNSINQMRKQVKQNPKNESAKQILFASYQNKIDLLNSVNERGVLMASMR